MFYYYFVNNAGFMKQAQGYCGGMCFAISYVDIYTVAL